MEFKFLDETIVIPEGIAKYQEILMAWAEFADKEAERIEEKCNSVPFEETGKAELDKWVQEFLNNIVENMILWLKKNECIVRTSEEICSNIHGNYLQTWKEIKEVMLKNTYSEDKVVKVIQVVIETLFSEARYIMDTCLDILTREKGYYIGPPTKEQCEEVKEILIKIEKGEMEGDKIKEALIQCIKLDGYNKDIYYYCLLMYGSKIDDALCEIADYFLVDIDDIVHKVVQYKLQGKKIKELSLEECNDLIDFIVPFGYSEDNLWSRLEKRREEINAESKREKYFEFLEEEIRIPEETVTYVNVLGAYKEEASNQSQKLREKYYDAYNLDSVAKGIDAWGTQLVTETVQKMLQTIRAMGIYDIDMDYVNQRYTRFINFKVWNDAVEHFAEQCAKCVYSEEQMKAYREQRKAQRGRFVGGGFGVSGAVKGSLQAGALNVATGAAHSVVNVLGNMASDARISTNKSNLYKANGTINDLCNALYEMIYSVHDAYLEILYDELDVVLEPSDEEDRNRAKALNNSVKSGVCSNEEIKELLIESIKCDLFNSETYALALEYAGDPYGYIAEMADFFMVDVSTIKEKMTSKFLDSIHMELVNLDAPMDISAWEKGKQKVLDYQKWLSYSNKAGEDAIWKVDWELRVCYAREMIANGKKYETKELAKQAKRDLAQIYQIAEDSGLSTEQAVQKVASLDIRSEDISNDRVALLEHRRKFIARDLQEIENEVLKVNAEVFELPHMVARNSRCTCTIEEYLRDRFFVVNTGKFDKMIEKINKAIVLEKDEKVLNFITQLRGIMLNGTGLVITNKKLYFISGKKILFQSAWELVNKIIAKEGKYIIYTADSNIFSYAMDDLESPYVHQVMSAYFERIRLLFADVYGKSKEADIQESDIEDTLEIEIPDVSELIKLVKDYVKEYDYISYLKEGEIHLYGDSEIEAKVNGALDRIGRDLSNEKPIVFTYSDKNFDTNMLITNKRIYWFFKDGPKDSVNIADIKAIAIKGKFLFAKPMAEMNDGSMKELPEIDLYLTHCKKYIEMLNIVLKVLKK